MVIDESQKICTVIDPTQPVTIDVISREMAMSLTPSYETSSQLVQTLKSNKTGSLLNDTSLRKQFKVDATTSKDSAIIFVEGGEQIDVPITDKSLTIAQLISFAGKSMNVEGYLASKRTKCVFKADENVFNLGEREFLLLEEKNIRRVCVNGSEDDNGRLFSLSATIADIFKAYQLNDQHQHLRFDDFVPSRETALLSLPSDSTIRLTIIDDNLPVTVTVLVEQLQGRSVQLNCSHSMPISRLRSISCQLFGIPDQSCQLTLSDGTMLDEELFLKEIGEDTSEINFQLIVPIGLSCSLTCDGN